jgi:hypothetical protein
VGLLLLKDIVKRVHDLIQITRGAKRIMEIGFNAGHSAELFLKYTSAHVTSFDLGDHPYVTHAKEYIDAYYPGRHSLILGDSTVMVPKCIGKYDVIFIDGGHDYEVARADLQNAKKLARKNTMYTPEWVHPYTVGPTQAWLESDRIEMGRDYENGKGMSWGKYNL